MSGGGFRGDVVKVLGKNGSTVHFSGGVARRNTGPMNAFLYSLFVTTWAGNLFVTGDEKLGSDFQILHTRTMTLDALLDIADSAKKSLAWMERQGLYKKIETASRMVEGGIILTQVWFTEASGVIKKLEVRKYAQYWEVEGEL